MNILKSAAVIAAGLFALAACQKPAMDIAALAEEMSRGMDAWAAAYNAGDADALAAMYADNGVVMPPYKPAAVGREAIREFLAADSGEARNAGLTLALSSSDIGAAGDLAWHSGSYSVTDASGAKVDSGKFIEVRQMIDGKWMIVRDIWNSDLPPAAAAAEATAEAAAPAG